MTRFLLLILALSVHQSVSAQTRFHHQAFHVGLDRDVFA